MNDFAKTITGKKFFERDIPRIAAALERIADELERLNENQEPHILSITENTIDFAELKDSE